MSEDFDVGYKRPPKHTRFKPGQSGNKKGRPKTETNLTAILEKVIAERMPVRLEGILKHVPAMEVIVRQAVIGASRGDYNSIKFLMTLSTKSGASFLDKKAADANSTEKKAVISTRLMELAEKGRKRYEADLRKEQENHQVRLKEIEDAKAELVREREALERAKRKQ